MSAPLSVWPPLTRMREVESRFVGAREHSIFWRLWLPEDPELEVRGRVIVAHGYGEHGGRYRHLGECLTGAGLAVVIPDHRGHGRSQGRRISVVSFDDYVDDLHRLAGLVDQQCGHAPTFVLGHSMGGLIAVAYTLRHAGGLRGLVLSAPAVLPPSGVSPVSLGVGRLVSRLVPNVGTVSLPVDQISRDRRVVTDYLDDPLVHRRRVRARLGAEMLRMMRFVSTGLPGLQLPILAMQGTSDRLVSPHAAEYVIEHAGSPDRTLKLYPGLYHEIFNEPERDAVLADLAGWLDGHLPPAPAAPSLEGGEPNGL